MMHIEGKWFWAWCKRRWHEAKLEVLEDPTVITNVKW